MFAPVSVTSVVHPTHCAQLSGEWNERVLAGEQPWAEEAEATARARGLMPDMGNAQESDESSAMGHLDRISSLEEQRLEAMNRLQAEFERKRKELELEYEVRRSACCGSGSQTAYSGVV